MANTKTFRVQHRIGTARHVVSFHDGEKTHRDGSAFFDARICRNRRNLKAFTRGLVEQGYVEAR